MKHLGDITKINGADIPPTDVICAGSPCQDLSVAGLRKGLQGERSGLFMEQIRIIKEMREHDRKANGRTDEFVRPRYMVWENVPGAKSSGIYKGADFRCVLEETARIVQEDAVIPQPPRGGGQMPDASWETDGASLGEYTMDSFGEKPYMLTEESCFPALPNGVSESRLSQILVDIAHPKYSLSAKACQGILNRANKRGKKLPEILQEALEAQIAE